MERFADRLRSLLAERGWTQEHLEDVAGFQRTALSRILRAKQKNLWPRTIKKLADAFSITTDELVMGISSPVPLEAAVTKESARASRAATLRGLPTLSRTLKDIPGYANAELRVVREERSVPLDVFEMMRETRLPAPPEVVTVEFLRELAAVFAKYVSAESGTQEKTTTASELVRPEAKVKKRPA